MKFDRSLFIGKFSIEAEEHLQKLNEGVLQLERGEADADPSTSSGQALMAEILRAAHTLKGSARMMGFKDINQVAHKLEDLLLEVKEGRLKASQAMCDLIFRALDTMDASRQAIVDGREDKVEVQGIVDLLESAAQGDPLDDLEPQPPPAAPPPTEPVPTPRQPAVASEERIRVSAAKLDKTIRLTGEVIAAQKRAEMRHDDLRRAWNMSREHWRQLRGHLDEEDPSNAGLFASGRALRNSLGQLMRQNREDVADLERVVLELQQDTLGLRMLPVSTVFDTFPRAVRDLARERGKELDLVISGGETELDRRMLERISDPLMHMLRNAVDHGLETPDERQAKGKNRRGKIFLNAYPLGGSIIIEVQDDGRGISLEAIRQKALEQGVVTEAVLRGMTDREIQSLIFRSGFSTSQVVSDISGRGVGLDVVRRNIIEELKGNITIETKSGEGTLFKLTLPLTLTTRRILFIHVAGHVFGLPITNVAETTRIRPDQVIQVVDREAIRLRDQIVPIASLAEVLELPGKAPSPPPGGWLYLVIAEVADELVGLIVDEVVNEEDVLIKPLPQHMKRIGILAGATISAAGVITPILHVPGLVHAVRGAASALRPAVRKGKAEESPRILVVDDSLNTREIEKSILEAHGYKVDLAKDGIDALRVIDQAPAVEGRTYYHLLIVDIEMPRLDGLSLTEQLRQDERYARVPIIIVSSRDKEQDRQRGLDVGADAYIVKGTFDQEDLTSTVASLLGRAAP